MIGDFIDDMLSTPNFLYGAFFMAGIAIVAILLTFPNCEQKMTSTFRGSPNEVCAPANVESFTLSKEKMVIECGKAN